MKINNTLEDSLIRLKNGYKSTKKEVDLLKSKRVLDLLVILRKEGFIKSFLIKGNYINVKLSYYNNKGAIQNLKIYSRLSTRSYLSLKDLRKFNRNQSGLSLKILTTNKGVLSDLDSIKERIGGRIIASLL